MLDLSQVSEVEVCYKQEGEQRELRLILSSRKFFQVTWFKLYRIMSGLTHFFNRCAGHHNTFLVEQLAWGGNFPRGQTSQSGNYSVDPLVGGLFLGEICEAPLTWKQDCNIPRNLFLYPALHLKNIVPVSCWSYPVPTQ